MASEGARADLRFHAREPAGVARALADGAHQHGALLDPVHRLGGSPARHHLGLLRPRPRAHHPRAGGPEDEAGRAGPARPRLPRCAPRTKASSAAPGTPRPRSTLVRLAGLHPAGVLCEILSADGRMANGRELERLARGHKLTLITIRDLIRYRYPPPRAAHQAGGRIEASDSLRDVPGRGVREPRGRTPSRRARPGLTRPGRPARSGALTVPHGGRVRLPAL